MSKIAIVYDRVTDRVFAGKASKPLKKWSNTPEDITGKFISAVVKYITPNSIRTLPKSDGSITLVLMNVVLEPDSLDKAVEKLLELKKKKKKVEETIDN